MSITTILGYMAIVAGGIAIVKMLFGTRGKVIIPGGFSIQWGK